MKMTNPKKTQAPRKPATTPIPMDHASLTEKDLSRLVAHLRQSWHRKLGKITEVVDGPNPSKEDLLPIFYLINHLQRHARSKSAVGNLLFDIALMATHHLAILCRTPPPWLKERAAQEMEVPWIMLCGKPAPGFEESDALMKWGNNNSRRGNAQFDVFSTKQTLRAFQLVWTLRKNPTKRTPKYAKVIWRSHTKIDQFAYEVGVLVWADIEQRIRALPELTSATRDQWWDVVKSILRIRAHLPQKYMESLKATLSSQTDRSILTEYIKRCKDAFYAFVLR